MRVLVAEDDEGLRSVLERGCRRAVTRSTPSETAKPRSTISTPMSTKSPFSIGGCPRSPAGVTQRLRRRGSALPILLLTARDTARDRVTGLDEGADDYLVKPFDFSELLARVRALQRRGEAMQSIVITVADLALDSITREVSIGSVRLRLTATELALLEILMQRSPAIVSRRSIALAVWNEEADALGSNTLDVHLARLRAKIATGGAKIESVRASATGLCRHEGPTPVASTVRGACRPRRCRGDGDHRAMYVAIVGSFDVVERNRLVAQIDSRLQERLASAIRAPATAGSVDTSDNARDVDDSPVFLWKVTDSGSSNSLTPGAPHLPRTPGRQRSDRWKHSLEVGVFGYRRARRPDWFVAAQSLANVNRIESDLLLLEAIAGPILLVAVFFGTLLVGVKAASPVELARRRQLEFTADASHELRTPLSVIEAEVTLSLKGPRSSDDYRATLGRVSRESMRLRDIVEDLLWWRGSTRNRRPPVTNGGCRGDRLGVCGPLFCGGPARRGLSRHGDDVKSQPWINAPPEWIDRLTAVLVDNACRYAGSGGTVLVAVK